MINTIVIILGIAFWGFIFILILNASENPKIKKYKKIKIGMSESEMLKKMGDGYTSNKLNDNRTEYVWLVTPKHRGYLYKGMLSGSGDKVKKVTIIVKNDVVEQKLCEII